MAQKPRATERKLSYDELDEALPRLAKSSPFNAARIAAEALVDSVTVLDLALKCKANDSLVESLVSIATPKLSRDLTRLLALLTHDVTNAASRANPSPIQFCGMTESSYLQIAW